MNKLPALGGIAEGAMSLCGSLFGELGQARLCALSSWPDGIGRFSLQREKALG